MSSDLLAPSLPIPNLNETAYNRQTLERGDARDQARSLIQSAERREKLVAALSKAENIPAGRLVIEKDPDTEKFVHTIVEPSSGKVLRQWPDDEFLARVKELGEAAGLWLDARI